MNKHCHLCMDLVGLNITNFSLLINIKLITNKKESWKQNSLVYYGALNRVDNVLFLKF